MKPELVIEASPNPSLAPYPLPPIPHPTQLVPAVLSPPSYSRHLIPVNLSLPSSRPPYSRHLIGRLIQAILSLHILFTPLIPAILSFPSYTLNFVPNILSLHHILANISPPSYPCHLIPPFHPRQLFPSCPAILSPPSYPCHLIPPFYPRHFVPLNFFRLVHAILSHLVLTLLIFYFPRFLFCDLSVEFLENTIFYKFTCSSLWSTHLTRGNRGIIF